MATPINALPQRLQNSTSMQAPHRIWDLPEILDMILARLPESDLPPCSLVNHTWQCAADRHLWQACALSDFFNIKDDHHRQRVGKAVKSGFAFIRTFPSSSQIQAHFSGNTQNCFWPQLLNLRLGFDGPLSGKDLDRCLPPGLRVLVVVMDPPTMINLPDVRDLLLRHQSQSTRLSSLTINCLNTPIRPPLASNGIMCDIWRPIIEGYTTLEHITIKSNLSQFPYALFAKLMLNWPALRTFKLQIHLEAPPANFIASSLPPQLLRLEWLALVATPKQLHPFWPSWTHLKRLEIELLKIEGTSQQEDETNLHHIIMSIATCHGLEFLTLSSRLRVAMDPPVFVHLAQSCPRLEDIHLLSIEDMAGYADKEALAVVAHMPGLRVLDIYGELATHSLRLSTPSLLQLGRCCPQLQRVRGVLTTLPSLAQALGSRDPSHSAAFPNLICLELDLEFDWEAVLHEEGGFRALVELHDDLVDLCGHDFPAMMDLTVTCLDPTRGVCGELVVFVDGVAEFCWRRAGSMNLAFV